MNNFFYYNDLYSIYKELLTEKEQEIFSTYYEYDNSLSEIATSKNVSRAAISKTINIAKQKLEHYEDVLKINAKNQKLTEICQNINDEKLKKLEELLK